MKLFLVTFFILVSYNFCNGQNLRIKNNDKLVCLISHDSTKSTIIGEKINDSITSITIYKRWKKQYNYQIVGNLVYAKLINEMFYAVFETYKDGVGAKVVEINMKDLDNVRDVDIDIDVSFNDVFDFEYYKSEICISSFIKKGEKIEMIKQGVFKNFTDTINWNRSEIPLAYYVSDSSTFIIEIEKEHGPYISLLQSINTKSEQFENLITVTTPFDNFDCLLRPDEDGKSINIILSSMISVIWNYEMKNSSLLYQQVNAPLYGIAKYRRRYYVFYVYLNKERGFYQTSGMLPKWKTIPFIFW